MILVVEDHEETRWALLRLLERTGYEAIGVADGAAALQFLQDHRPRLIVLDHMMPYATGLTVLKWVRAEPRVHSIPVLVYTAHDSPAMRETMARAGATDVIAKDGTWDVLLAAVAKHAPMPPPHAPTPPLPDAVDGLASK